MKRKFTDKRGMSLVEIVVILIIMAILAAILVPALLHYIDKSKAAKEVTKARHIAEAAQTAATDWYCNGAKGNSDNAIKINIENLAIEYMDGDVEGMHSYMAASAANKSENLIQIGLSLPSYVSQGWPAFITACKTNKRKNFALVYLSKNPDMKINPTVHSIYYVSADGGIAVKIVYTGGTKLGDVGTSYEFIN